jgi:oxygen-independent coproporphyrinogen-3 oxidase
VATVYFGGGTPSLLHPESLATLLEAVAAQFDGSPGEVTLEVNPSTVERDRLPAFRRAGINRLSIGVQSFDDTVLRRLGRAHRGVECDETLRAARAAGFTNLSLDLIFGAPGQDEASLATDLERAVAHHPEHISAYTLTVEGETPFARAAARGKLPLPEEAEGLAMLERVWGTLTKAGYRHYELSNFARPGFAAAHNRRYWERAPVLALGVGACSFDPATVDAPHSSATRPFASRSFSHFGPSVASICALLPSNSAKIRGFAGASASTR